MSGERRSREAAGIVWLMVVLMGVAGCGRAQRESAPQKTETERKVIEARAEFQRFADEGGKSFAPIHFARMETLIAQIEGNLSRPSPDYPKAIALSQEAVIMAQEGVAETQRRRCEFYIARLNGMLAQAKYLRAEYFRSRFLETLQRKRPATSGSPSEEGIHGPAVRGRPIGAFAGNDARTGPQSLGGV